MDGLGVGLRQGLARIGLGVVKVAEEAGLAGAVLDARGLLALGAQVLAEVALLHDTQLVVVVTDAVGAGIHAELAADAGFLVHENHAVFLIAKGSTRGARVDAGGIGALLALLGEPPRLDVGELAVGLHLVQLVPVMAQGHAVLHLARQLAAVATNAAIQVNNQAVTRHRRHYLLRCSPRAQAATE